MSIRQLKRSRPRNSAIGSSRGARSCPQAVLVLVGTVSVLLISFNKVTFSDVIDYNSNLLLSAERMVHAPTANKGPSSLSRGAICPWALDLFEDTSVLTSAIEQAQLFHDQGGNLVALQDYLNRNIESTLKQVGMVYHHKPKRRSESPEIEVDVSNVTAFLKDYYAKLNDPRGGYGRRLPGKFHSPGNPALHNFMISDRFLPAIFEPVSNDERWTVSLGPLPSQTCDNLITFGSGYQKKWFCGSVIKEKNTSHNENCNVVSIGSNDQWSFERGVLAKMRHCHTHTFDCTLPGDGLPKSKPHFHRAHFYPHCIGSPLSSSSTKSTSPSSSSHLPYAQLLEMAGIAAPKLLKIDVEGFEYQVFVDILQNTPSSLLPEQIIVEMHAASRMTALSWLLRVLQAGELGMFFGALYRTGGYIPVFKDYNPGCPVCLEVLFVRAICD